MSFSGAISYGFIFLGISSLANPVSGSGVKLQRAHPLFGKCTTSDLHGPVGGGGTSFLQDEKDLPSNDECMQLLGEDDDFFPTVLDPSDGDSGEAESPITKSSSQEEIIARAKELLDDDLAKNSNHSRAMMKSVWALLKNATNESTLFVLGLGPELFAFSKISKNVIAVETDDGLCQNFLRSKAGACAMQPNVHIYCAQPTSSQEKSDRGALLQEAANSGRGASLEQDKDMAPGALEHATSREDLKLFQASKILVEDLVIQQFGDVPVSALVVLGRYPVAKLLLMQQFLDQSTVILSLSRMTTEGLEAISGLMRVLITIRTGYNPSLYSIKSILLLQRLFSPTKQEDLWMKYTTAEWALNGTNSPLQLIDTIRKAAHSVGSAKGMTQRALDTYLDIFAHATATGTDKEWEDITASLQSLQARVGNGDNLDGALAAAREFAVKTVDAAAAKAGLQEYVKLIMNAIKKQKEKDDSLVHATACRLISDAASMIASSYILDKVKDGIEDACDLAESKPQLFLPALRLIQKGLMTEESMATVAHILPGLKNLDPTADISSLTSLTECREA